jgi:phage virion morphogenesis protein
MRPMVRGFAFGEAPHHEGNVMTGVRLAIGGKEETLSELSAVLTRLREPRGMWDNIGASLVVSTQHRFEAGVSPEGSPWPPSIRARLGGGRTLIDTGRLMASLTHIASDPGIEVGTNVLYAAVHQLGATIKPKSAAALKFKIGDRWATASQVTIPARPFLGIDGDDEREIVAIAEDWIAGEEAGNAH